MNAAHDVDHRSWVDLDNSLVRVLIVGDSGVGKTSFLYNVCSQEVLTTPSCPTIGCTLGTYVYTRREHGNQSSQCFIECIDIGGHVNYKDTRKVFYNSPFHGVMYVFDHSSPKSYRNISRYISEIKTAQMNNSSRSSNHAARFNELHQFPQLIVGNKYDRRKDSDVAWNPLRDYKMDHIDVNSLCSGGGGMGMMMSSHAQERFHLFLDRVVISGSAEISPRIQTGRSVRHHG